MMTYKHPVFGPDRYAAAREAYAHLRYYEELPAVECGFAPAYVYALRDEAKAARDMYAEFSDELLAGGGYVG